MMVKRGRARAAVDGGVDRETVSWTLARLKSKLKSVWCWFRIDSKGSNLIGVAIQNERRQTETIATLIQFF